MDLRLPRDMVWPTSDVEEAATRYGLAVLEDGRVEPLHWRNLLEEARVNGKLLDMQSSLVDGLTCKLCSEIVHEPVLLECGCSMLICGKHAPMLDRCPHCRSPQQFQGGRAAKPNRQLQAVLNSITFMCPRCGRTVAIAGLIELANRLLFYDLRTWLVSGWTIRSTWQHMLKMTGTQSATKCWRSAAEPLRMR